MEIFPDGSVRGRTTEYILTHPKKKIKVTEIARELAVSKGHVSEVISDLKKEGIVKKSMVDLTNPYVRALKIAININKIKKSGVISKIRSLGIEKAGLYGSWANGNNTEESDIDIWVKPDDVMKGIDIAKLSDNIRKTLKIEPQIVVLSEEKLKRLKEDNEVFYFTLVLGSIILMGEGIGRTG